MMHSFRSFNRPKLTQEQIDMLKNGLKEIEQVKLLNDAITFAHTKHKGQSRKSFAVPYTVHPLEIMYKLSKQCIKWEIKS